jgi:hypothetical protein
MTIAELIMIKIEETQKELDRLKLLLPNVSGQLPSSQITDKEHKRLMKALYTKDRSKKFRR